MKNEAKLMVKPVSSLRAREGVKPGFELRAMRLLKLGILVRAIDNLNPNKNAKNLKGEIQ